MGIILDSSVLVAAERRGQNAHRMLASISLQLGDTDIAISVVTLMELARADTPDRKAKREQFVRELISALPVHPVSPTLALRAGQIDGEKQAQGIRIPLTDLLIGVTAMELGYSVATANVRHFQLVPGLSLVRL